MALDDKDQTDCHVYSKNQQSIVLYVFVFYLSNFCCSGVPCLALAAPIYIQNNITILKDI